MKKLFAVLALGLTFSVSALAENSFPSYLTEKYCNDIKLDFMTSSIKSLQHYKDKQLASRHRGGMRNIQRYLKQRQDWLLECDNYLSATSQHKRLFRNEETTDEIFTAIDSVSTELGSLIAGVTYADEPTEEDTVVEEKFDQLFQLVEAHQTLLLLRGQVVYR
jgi:hypothetical protein